VTTSFGVPLAHRTSDLAKSVIRLATGWRTGPCSSRPAGTGRTSASNDYIRSTLADLGIYRSIGRDPAGDIQPTTVSPLIRRMSIMYNYGR
jgi:hypothetical protein